MNFFYVTELFIIGMIISMEKNVPVVNRMLVLTEFVLSGSFLVYIHFGLTGLRVKKDC